MNESGVWIDAPPLPDAYAVNIGDMLELWTNGEFVATSHRVRKVSEERYSFPLFFAVDGRRWATSMKRWAGQDARIQRFISAHRTRATAAAVRGTEVAVGDEAENLEHEGRTHQCGVASLIVRRRHLHDVAADEIQAA